MRQTFLVVALAALFATNCIAEISNKEAARLCKQQKQMTKEDILGCELHVQLAESLYGCKPSTAKGEPPLTALFKCRDENDKRVEERDRKAAAAAKAKPVLPGVSIGMTARQVLEESNWGKPKSVNRTTTARGTSEQWVYGGNQFLYFENGILTAVQN